MNSTLPKAFKLARLRLGGVAILVLLRATNACAQNSQVFFDPDGNLLLEMAEASAPPQIIGQPQMQVVQPGATATFSVVALDPSGLSYQWLFSGTNLPGQTSDALQISNVSSNNQGYYSVVLGNSSGSATSSPAPLWIDSRGCGMPDWWQFYYFSNLNQNASADFDGDGVSNLQEFLDGTNPTNAASARFRLSIINLGSVVTATPNFLSYSNGATVSLSANGIPPYNFRGWGGDVSGTNNPVTLTMTNNKTIYAYAGAFTLTWTNSSSGDWNTAANWSPNFVPDPSDNVLITSSVTVSSSNSIECGSITLGAPGSSPTLSVSGNLTLGGPSYWVSSTINCTGTLTISNVMNWTAGTMGGAGTTIIAPGATLNAAANPYTLTLSCTLENAGTVLWTGVGINMNSAVVTNCPGALFLVQNSTSINASSSRFDNAGTFRKNASPGTTTLSGLNFNNYGLVDLQTGTLQCTGSFTNSGSVNLAPGTTNLISGGGLATGPFAAPAGALVALTGNSLTPPFTLLPGAQLNGFGTYQLNGATVNFNTDITVQNLDLLITLGGIPATLNGTGTLTISNVMNWISGSMGGTGTTTIAPGATLNATANPYTLGLSRTLKNAGTMLWTGVGISLSSAVLTNCPGALILAQNSASLSATSSRFDNAGTFRKNVSQGTTTLAALNFNNYGLVDLQTGTLQCAGSFTNSGSVNLAPGTTNLISGGGLATGPFKAPATALVDWTGSGVSTAFTLSSGVQLNGAGVYRMDGATVNFDTDLGVQNLDLISTGVGNPPTLTGSGILTISNVMNWTQGTMSGSGLTIIAPGATLNAAANPYTLSLSRSLENAGTVLWTGVGISLNSAVLTNCPGALFLVQNSASLNATSSRFDNAGTFRKTVGPDATTLYLPFNNYGTVDLRLGALTANGGYNSAPNALLNCVLGGTSAGTNYGQLQVAGAVTLNGGLSVILANGFVPATNNAFVVVTAGTRNGTFANFYYPSNAATMQLSNTPSSVIVQVTGVAPVPPLLLTPAISSSNVLLTWTAIPNATYRLEFNPNLAPSNWSALSGDVTSSNNFASKLDLLTPSNRFYRLRLLP
jgi:hypothetical protein